jgi:ASC-1-like (ASCH) protein
MTRRLITRPEWEDAIRSGAKTIDARLVADDVADLHTGQIVRYPGARVCIRRIRYYSGFRDLLAHEDCQRIAPGLSDRDELLRVLEEGHEATIRASGAVAIEIERLPEGPRGARSRYTP